MGDEVCLRALKNRTWFKHICLSTDVGRCDWAGCARAGQFKTQVKTRFKKPVKTRNAELSFGPGRHPVLLGQFIRWWGVGLLMVGGQLERFEETR